MNKAQMREHLRDCLQELTTEQRRNKSNRACRLLVELPVFQEASVVMMFLSLPDEIDTTEALETAWAEGKTVVVPKIRWKDRHMEAVQVHSLQDEFNVCPRGLRCPTEHQIVPLEDIDLVITPGLGFDENGHRLGRGGAFYDRFFHQERLHAQRYGLAYEEQVVSVIPTVPHDRPVDGIITDERVIMPLREGQGI